ncbi:unnamed protein product [Schistocephalus solidus]|uniref:BPTI/Kunitz inhibitor domain-containing protein n=1 Tax=Schistocephalus solidus TaxID=70667 RepID=A0A183SAM5_SCHSO|nr:unnamed protein product [Schistocephalus solidus]
MIISTASGLKCAQDRVGTNLEALQCTSHVDANSDITTTWGSCIPVAADSENSGTVTVVYSISSTRKDTSYSGEESSDGETKAITNPDTVQPGDTAGASTSVPKLGDLGESESVTPTETSLQSTAVHPWSSVDKEVLLDASDLDAPLARTESTVLQNSVTALATAPSTTPTVTTSSSSTVDDLEALTEAPLGLSNLSTLYSEDGSRDVEVRCKIIPDIAPCTQAVRGVHWYFDSIEQRCLSTTDCISNENNFSSEEECMVACHHKIRKFISLQQPIYI